MSQRYNSPSRQGSRKCASRVRLQRSAAIPSRVIATCFAICCFIAAALLGVYNQNPAWSVLVSSLLVMLVAYPVGRILGSVAQRCVDEQVEKHRQANPIPEDTAADTEPGTA